MPDTVFGLPLHPLVVHAVVVLVPLASLGAVALALVPRWRTTYGWLVLAAATISLGAVPVATRSGNRFAASLQLGGPVAEKVAEHKELGERVIWAVVPLWLGLAVGLLLRRRRAAAGVETAAMVVAALAGVAATILVALAGHAGSSAVWNPTG